MQRRALRAGLFAAVGLGLVPAGIGLAPAGAAAPSGSSQSSGPNLPTWWVKYQSLLHQTSNPTPARTTPTLKAGANVDVSNEVGPQSETSITVDPKNSRLLVAGSNEFFRLPMRGSFSSDGGNGWGAVDLPLPPAATTNGTDFGSDPGVAFDTQGNVYYGYIVVFFNRIFRSIQGTEVAVAKSFDHGATWPQVTFFNFNSGSGKFNDKPMIAVDTNPSSPHRDSVYVAWDNASLNAGKSSTNDVLLFTRSTDGGKTFSTATPISPTTGGPNAVIGADPYVGSKGEVYVAWHDVQRNQLVTASSFNGGAGFGSPVVISPTLIAFDDAIPAMASRRALLYPG